MMTVRLLEFSGRKRSLYLLFGDSCSSSSVGAIEMNKQIVLVCIHLD